jgi:hypothetical protein
MMNLKNYSSTVPAERSLFLIEKILMDLGASNISKSINENKEVDGIVFMIQVNGLPMLFKLKARVDEVYKRLYKDASPRTAFKKETIQRIKEQSKKTAWKLAYDRMLMDATDIELGNMELMELFITRAYDMANNQTFYEKLKQNDFKQLTQ